MKIIYSIGIYLVGFVLRIYGLFNTKINTGVKGRQYTFQKLKNTLNPTDRTFWFHCASLGEYEQGLPLFERLRADYPNHKMVLSFFSPSGYEVRKNSPIADVVVYLPLDTPKHAKAFIDIVNPELSLFVKYEVWPNMLLELQRRNLRVLLVSAVFRKDQIFFKWYGRFMRKALGAFTHIFTQDDRSFGLLQSHGFKNVTVSGDTRYDRVSNQLTKDNTVDFIARFLGDSLCLVFGSTWPEDDKLFMSYINGNASEKSKYIIAPHNIKRSYITSIKNQLKVPTICYSNMTTGTNLNDYKVFILDTIGYLGRVYSYADIAYVGGAAGQTGLHNILEPAVFGVPIIIGKNYDKFPEAKALIALGGVNSVKSTSEFSAYLKDLLADPKEISRKGQINSDFISTSKGAVNHINAYISALKL